MEKQIKNPYPLLSDFDKARLSCGNPFKIMNLLIKHVSPKDEEWRKQAKAYSETLGRLRK